MVGDSTNDAAALAAADVGVAIGTGSAVALECAQIILVRNDLRDLADAISISKRAVRAIKGNIFWALIFCAVMLPFAAGLLRAFGGPLLDPISQEFAWQSLAGQYLHGAGRLSRADIPIKLRTEEHIIASPSVFL